MDDVARKPVYRGQKQMSEHSCFSKFSALRVNTNRLFLLCTDWFLLRQRPADFRCGWGFLHRSPLGRSSNVHGHRERWAGTSLRLQTQPGTKDCQFGILCVCVFDSKRLCQILQKLTPRRLWWCCPCVFSLLHYQDGQFEHEFTLKPVNQCCSAHSASCTNKNEPCGARFGTAIAAVSDLNLDGFNDVAIGAPFENDHRGAVYIYHGDKTSLKEKFVQVRTVPVPLNKPLRTMWNCLFRLK